MVSRDISSIHRAFPKLVLFTFPIFSLQPMTIILFYFACSPGAPILLAMNWILISAGRTTSFKPTLLLKKEGLTAGYSPIIHSTTKDEQESLSTGTQRLKKYERPSSRSFPLRDDSGHYQH